MQDLAAASLEVIPRVKFTADAPIHQNCNCLKSILHLLVKQEVNKMWAGLGYYSRGKRLHEGAQKVCYASVLTLELNGMHLNYFSVL